MNFDHPIFLIGAGAIGKALAVFLQREGRAVTILRGTVDGESKHSEIISVETTDGSVLSEAIAIDTLSNHSTLNGLLLLTNKSYGNDCLAQKLKAKSGASPLVILQNGLNVEEPFLRNDFPHVYRCVLFATSQQIAEARFRFKPVASSPVGIIEGDEQTLSGIVAQLHTDCFPFSAETDIEPIIWTKAIANSVFNSVCPLLETDNGIFFRNQKAVALANRVIEECVQIAGAAGVRLEKATVVVRLLQISKASEGQLISTYQDILNGRETEIEALNFAIVDAARKLGNEDAVRETRLLGELIKLKSELKQMD